MNRSEHYEGDVLAYFSERPQELALYEEFSAALDRMLPEISVKVQKSQISFYGRHLFAAASLPVRRKKGWPEHCLLVTFGLPERLDDPRIAAAVEPYPNRWTHHVVVSRLQEIDEQLMAWIREAYEFSQNK